MKNRYLCTGMDNWCRHLKKYILIFRLYLRSTFSGEPQKTDVARKCFEAATRWMTCMKNYKKEVYVGIEIAKDMEAQPAAIS